MNKPIHSARLERWLGKERVEALSSNFRGWYGPPVVLLDIPGGVRVNGDGDFSGTFERGAFMSAMDTLEVHAKRLTRRFGAMRLDPATLQMGGFTSISNALSSLSGGSGQLFAGGNIQKVGIAPGAVGDCVDLFYVGNNPGAGAAPAAVPGGTVPTNATTGAMNFNSPAPTNQFTMLIGADMQSSVAAMSVMLYDRLFSVLQTASSSTTHAVTGVQTRYNSTTQGQMNYAGGNFMFISEQSTLGAVSHNWTVCQYTNQANTAAQSFPSITGTSGCVADALDMPAGQWFAPLVSGDTGVLQLTQTQCSVATVTGNATFNVGHPIGIMSFPLANFVYPFDWLTNRSLAPRIMDGACLALLQLPVDRKSATTFTGNIYG